ncbi:hypothetical protein [Pseudoduganella lutea]|uniref:Aspartyl protease n=1 Tax=Pseudoduganella lutea TaxID=321985 RepID=A0A4P6L2G0_9BURK|nr:hypothetical protein [Pseudoduganella lutea]QBE65008.1 hypothetical protein EWM63_20090 [Pseudoduganella lutea]
MIQRWIGAAAALATVFAAAAARAEVSVPLALERGIPVAQLTIAGHVFPFTFDIGSSRTLHLTREVMARIPGLKLTGRKMRSADLTGKVREEEEFVIPDLVVNGVSFGEVKGVSYEAWGLGIGKGAGLPPHSVVGLGLFARQPFVYDQSGRTLRFGAPLEPGSGWQPLAHERVHEGIVASLSNERARYRLVLDSAANISIVKPQSVEKQGDRPTRCDVFGPDKPCSFVSVSLPGGAAITPYLMPLPGFFQPDGILGADFFGRYAVYVDQAQGKVAVRPPSR